MSTGTLDEALARANALIGVKPALAERQAASILQAVPGHPQAELILGSARRRLGHLANARAVLEPLARTQPRAALVQYEWGLTQAEMGETAGAVTALRLAVTLRPGLTEAWRALGDMHMLAGEPASADAAYAQHILTSVNDPALMQAATALVDGDLPLAEHRLRAHLAANPTDLAAMRMLAETGTRLGRYADAESLLAHCLRLMPSFRPARHNYAVVLFRQNKAEEALPHIEKLLAEDSCDPSFRNLKAACLALVGEYDHAIGIYAGIVREFPAQAKIWLSYGHVLRTAGQRSDAIAAYRRTLALAPGFGEAYWSLANLKEEVFSTDDVSAMQRQLVSDATTVEDRFHLHFALGRALEQAGCYPDSWQNYAAGARMRRGEISYDADRTHHLFARIGLLMSADFFAGQFRGGCDDPAPIFIVGLPRSGSTLIEQILSSHSQVEGTSELSELANISRDLGRSGVSGTDRYPERLADLSPTDREALGHRYLDRTRIHRKTNRPLFIDKLPNNFVHIGLIQLILPNAKIIDARRQPMAACFSAFKQHFARGQHFSYDLTELGRYYADYVALMDHFDRVLPGRVHRVLYEDMVGDTEGEVRRLLAYCGLDFEPGCLRFHENTRAVRTASSEQVRRPIFREGLDHWRHFAPWLDELRAALGPLAAD